ncbi:MAG: squalene synthase HpnC [Acidocella sp. 20-57-95]|nr:MAG: squalene synthase HpnC [Acidocella sp. 20-57-95]HQT62945.1 squalene synthase HpnC [Acidocella sp.]
MSANDNKRALPASPPDVNVENASGKGKGDENFPVGSFLIRANLRRHVHAFYNFARNADDIADHPTLSPEDKVARLNVMEAVLTGMQDTGAPSALALRTSLQETNVSDIHARELLVAFRQDATKTRYENWAALLDYCRYSAAPVGRYVLDLHGESRVTWPASDALCAALQVNNHLQDVALDLRNLDRCYVPQDWLAQHHVSTDDIARGASVPGLRAVFDAMLVATDKLNEAGLALPGLVKARRLRVETAVIARLAICLTMKLKQHDALAMRVKLDKFDFIKAMMFASPRLLWN